MFCSGGTGSHIPPPHSNGSTSTFHMNFLSAGAADHIRTDPEQEGYVRTGSCHHNNHFIPHCPNEELFFHRLDQHQKEVAKEAQIHMLLDPTFIVKDNNYNNDNNNNRNKINNNNNNNNNSDNNNLCLDDYLLNNEKANGRSSPDTLAAMPPRRRSIKRDRHSKINTRQGPRDRRMRLSLEIARKFFDLQDMLGYDKGSKTVEWLLMQSKTAIEDLVSSLSGNLSPTLAAAKSNASSTTTTESEEAHKALPNPKPFTGLGRNTQAKARAAKSQQRSTAAQICSRKESRERARERAKEKMYWRKRGFQSPPNRFGFESLKEEVDQPLGPNHSNAMATTTAGECISGDDSCLIPEDSAGNRWSSPSSVTIYQQQQQQQQQQHQVVHEVISYNGKFQGMPESWHTVHTDGHQAANCTKTADMHSPLSPITSVQETTIVPSFPMIMTTSTAVADLVQHQSSADCFQFYGKHWEPYTPL